MFLWAFFGLAVGASARLARNAALEGHEARP
jgi:hypothetical protein